MTNVNGALARDIVQEHCLGTSVTWEWRLGRRGLNMITSLILAQLGQVRYPSISSQKKNVDGVVACKN